MVFLTCQVTVLVSVGRKHITLENHTCMRHDFSIIAKVERNEQHYAQCCVRRIILTEGMLGTLVHQFLLQI